MAEIILHIGLHKTATGTLQRQFFPACSDLELLTTRNPGMRAFVEAVTRTDPIYFAAGPARKLIESSLSNVKPNLLSNESFSGPPYAGVIESGLDHRSPVLANLKAVFPEARTIVVLRRQDSLARSFYRQYLKSGGTHSVWRFYGLDEKGRPPLMSLNRFVFSPYLDAVFEAFPAGVLVLPFEAFVRDQQQFLERITDFIGVQCPSIDLKRENATAVGPVGMQATRMLNHFFRSKLNPAGLIPGLRTNRHGISRRISPVQYLHDGWPGKGSSKGGASAEAAKEILERVREDNRSLDSKYSLGLADLGYY